MEKARIEHKGSLYFVGSLNCNGQTETHPLALSFAEYEALAKARPSLFKATNLDGVKLVCGCCGSELEPGFGAAFVHADPNDRAHCPTSLTQFDSCSEYLTEKSFDVLHVKGNLDVFSEPQVRLENEKRLATLMAPLTHEEVLLPKHRERLAPFDEQLSALVGARVYPGLVQVYQALLFGRYRPEDSRNAREYRGIGHQTLMLFEDNVAHQIVVPRKLRLYFSRGRNAVKVGEKPVEVDITESFIMRGYSLDREPDDFTGLKSRNGILRPNATQTRLMT